MGATGIDYVTKAWNVVVGCDPISAGCEHCWARELHNRRHLAWVAGKAMPWQYRERFDVVQLMYERFEEPKHWKQPQVVLVSSQGDLFHKDVPDEALDRIFEVMESEERHLFLVLTKRAKRMQMYFRHRNWQRKPAANIWAGVSVEDQRAAEDRIGYLLVTPAGGHWVSAEPLIMPVNLGRIVHEGIVWNALRGKAENPANDDGEIEVAKLDFVAAGGENGVGSRPCHPDWARLIRDGCQANGVKFWWKGWGRWWPSFPQYEDTDSVEKYEGDHDNMGLMAEEELCLGWDGSVSQHWYRGECGDVYQPSPAVNPWWMLRLGKKMAGRQLDGRTWEQGPR